MQAKLAAPLTELLQTHNQAVDPNLVQLAEAWAQAEAALQAQGKSTAALEASAAVAGEEGPEEEEELDAAAGGAQELPEDLQVGCTGQVIICSTQPLRLTTQPMRPCLPCQPAGRFLSAAVVLACSAEQIR